MTTLTVATCQFPVSGDIGQNAGWITRQAREAAGRGARVAHFPEGALSGYAGTDFATFAGFDCGITCGALICYDYRFPELYRHYVTLDVQLMFHSFHAGNVSPDGVAAIGAAIGTEYAALNPAATFTYPGITMPAVMTGAAACNNVWISCPNSSAPESLWPAFFVRSDGITIGRLERNAAGVLISRVDTEQDLYDSTGPWRRRAIAGVLHSGELAEEDR
jgi:predicted amidohydrolase